MLDHCFLSILWNSNFRRNLTNEEINVLSSLVPFVAYNLHGEEVKEILEGLSLVLDFDFMKGKK